VQPAILARLAPREIQEQGRKAILALLETPVQRGLPVILAHKVIPEAQVRPETPARLAHRATQVRKVTPESVPRGIPVLKATRALETRAHKEIPARRAT